MDEDAKAVVDAATEYTYRLLKLNASRERKTGLKVCPNPPLDDELAWGKQAILRHQAGKAYAERAKATRTASSQLVDAVNARERNLAIGQPDS